MIQIYALDRAAISTCKCQRLIAKWSCWNIFTKSEIKLLSVTCRISSKQTQKRRDPSSLRWRWCLACYRNVRQLHSQILERTNTNINFVDCFWSTLESGILSAARSLWGQAAHSIRRPKWFLHGWDCDCDRISQGNSGLALQSEIGLRAGMPGHI